MEKVECTTISVDCCHNDPVDIRCGGPYYLGFDFFVRRHEEQEMVKFIIATIEELHVPLMSVNIGDVVELTEDHVWTKERILASITKEADELRSEAQRPYNQGIRPHM